MLWFGFKRNAFDPSALRADNDSLKQMLEDAVSEYAKEKYVMARNDTSAEI